MGVQRKNSGRFYTYGLIAGLCFLVAAELIWVPAPIQTEGGIEWIEMIDWLFYALIIVPILWLTGAVLGIMRANTRRAWHLWLRIIIILLSLFIIGILVFWTERLELLLIGVGIVIVLLFVDMFVSEVNNHRSNIPWRSGTKLLIMVVLLALLAYPTNYSVTYPGMTLNLNRYAHIEGGQAVGSVDGVLVFDRPAVLADWLYARMFPLYRFEPIPENEPPLSETYAQVVAMKTDANKVAAAIALQRAGIGNGITADGVTITAILKDSPADGILQAGDVIVQANEVSVRTTSELISYMTEMVKPGDVMDVTLRRDGVMTEIAIPTVKAADDPDRAVLGISITTATLLDVPRDIQYNSYMAHIGGPSHGAMITLAFMDQLISGGVTYGFKVAGTGTIEPDGSIGMVGGIPQKAYAVSRTDADVFFVPAAGEQAARVGAPDLNIVAVENIDDVLNWLANAGK